MKGSSFAALTVGALLLFLPLVGPVQAQVHAGVVFDRDGLRHFHLAIGHVYGVPVAAVARFAPAYVHPDELPVVYFLAREARVSPETVIALRSRGWSWVDVTIHLGLSPAIFVAHLPRQGPPFGLAHGYWRKRGASQLRYLSDREIVDFMNVQFWGTYYRQPVTQVIVVRERYPDWAVFASGYRWAPPAAVAHAAPPLRVQSGSGGGTAGRGQAAGGVRSSGRPGASAPAAAASQPTAPTRTATPAAGVGGRAAPSVPAAIGDPGANQRGGNGALTQRPGNGNQRPANPPGNGRGRGGGR